VLEILREADVPLGAADRTLSAGMAAHVGRGERVSLANPGPEPASLMVVASPADFARQVATWPAA
jgi:hypothetical protein